KHLDDGEFGFMSEVEHVVVLMLENRGFDHFMGWLYGEKDDPEGDLKKVNSIGSAVHPWTGQPLRVFEGLSGLDLKALSCPYDYVDEHSESKPRFTKTADHAPNPKKGARFAVTPRINPHEDFIHIFEDMYYGGEERGLKVDKLHLKMGRRNSREELIMRDGPDGKKVYLQP